MTGLLRHRPSVATQRRLVCHAPTGFMVDPTFGVIYGSKGNAIGAVCADGYVRLGGNKHKSLYAHRVIWEAVHGPIPAGHCIDHLNGQRADNRIFNLDAVTPSQNAQRAVLFGTAPLGERKSNAKLTEENVRAIRSTIGVKPTRQWARELGVDPATVRAVRHYRTWRHVVCRGRRKPSAPHARNGRRQ